MKAALRIALLYVLLSGIYIQVSDRAVEAIASGNSSLITSWQSVKGLAFIIASAFIIFSLVLHYVRTQQRIQRALDEARHSFEQLFNRTPLPLFVYDLDTLRFVGVNHAAIEEYGYSKEEFLNLKITQIHPPEDIEKFLAHLAKNKNRPFFGRSRHIRKDGTRIEVEVIAHCMEFRGEDTRLVLSTNITCRTVVEQALADTFAARAEAEKTKSRFLSTISHEMRTPLNAITGFLDLLAKEPDEAQRQDFIVLARNGAEDLVALVERLIETTSLGSRPSATRREEVRLRDYLERITASFVNNGLQKQIAVKFSPDPSLPQLARLDAWWLEQTLQILFGNAIKFSHGGSVRLRADMSVRASGEAVLSLAVSDEGIGIPAEQHKRIFESFTQVDEGTSREFGGVGMGLFVARQLCDLMGASITVESQEDKGSTFTIVLSGRLSEEGTFVVAGEA